MSIIPKLSPIVQVDKELQLLMRDFMVGRNEDCETLKAAIDTKNWPQIAQLGHKLAGVCGGYGFDELGQLGEQLEVLSQSRQIEDVKNLLMVMKSYVSTVKIEYK